MSREVHITLIDLSVGYGKTRVLSGIDMGFEKGGIHCIFGRNGSGKTTLLKSISGFIPRLKGRIEIQGVELKEMSAKQVSTLIATVLTTRPMVPNMLVEDYVAFGRYPYTNWIGKQDQKDEDLVERAIQLSSVDSIRKRAIIELSDGEMQKVQIARAMAQDCPILLLDEIASHLDLVNKAEIFNLLKRIGKEGEKTILFTSHDLQFALQLADTFVIVENGNAQKMPSSEFIETKAYDRILKSDFLEIDAANNSLKFKSTS